MQNERGRDLSVRRLVDRLCEPGAIEAWMQPVVRLSDLEVTGFEALARSPTVAPTTSPEVWLHEAEAVGERNRLELACLDAVIAAGDPPGQALMFVNLSPSMLISPETRARRALLPRRLVLEMSEQHDVDSYPQLRDALAQWAGDGVHLAIDDAGVGYSSLKRIIEVAPEFVKIDRSLVRAIHTDRNCQAMLRALVTFASEVGASVIAEGVEHHDELTALRELNVPYAQGYLLGRPAPAYRVDRRAMLTPSAPAAKSATGTQDPDLADLSARLAATTDPESAAALVVDELFHLGGVMPSVYLERQGTLRCAARRGLWQVLDGMSPHSGITGWTWANDEIVHVTDVEHDERYLEAIPGVVAEYCVPIRIGRRAVGALNLDSLNSLSTEMLAAADACAAALGDHLATLGPGTPRTSWQRVATASSLLSRTFTAEPASDPSSDPSSVVAAIGAVAAIEISGLASALVVARGSNGQTVTSAVGPLSDDLLAIDDDDLAALRALVASVRSCYTAGEASGRGFAGTEGLRRLGVRTAVVLPLNGGGVNGLLLLVDRRHSRIAGELIEPLEVLATLIASALSTRLLLTELAHQATTDRLTGLGNRTALHNELERCTSTAVVVGDVDGFKHVNDRFGHAVGDDLLVALADALRSTLDPDRERCFRYGGDEIVVLCPAGPAEGIYSLERRIVEAADEILRPYGAALSTGVAQTERGEHASETVKRADHDLLARRRRRPVMDDRLMRPSVESIT